MGKGGDFHVKDFLLIFLELGRVATFLWWSVVGRKKERGGVVLLTISSSSSREAGQAPA